MDVLTERTCPLCQGTGAYTAPSDCPDCGGTGHVARRPGELSCCELPRNHREWPDDPGCQVSTVS